MDTPNSRQSGPAEQKCGWRPRLKHELTEYAINFVYLALFLSVFAWYRRLVLAEYSIPYLRYGTALIKALILAKVIMLGDWLRLGHRMESRPLIVSTLYRTLLFAAWVALFEIVEKVVVNLILGHGWRAGVTDVLSGGRDELLAAVLVMLLAFIPFFAFKEAERVLGEGTLRRLFFRRRPA
jgi:hypothetical protein